MKSNLGARFSRGIQFQRAFLMIKITYFDKFTGKDLWAEGEVKSFCDYTPKPSYVNDVSEVLDKVRYDFDIDDDVELYIFKFDWDDDGSYIVQYFSGSPHRGVNMSDHQRERFEAGKCCGWNHDIHIRLEKVTYEPITDFPTNE